MSRLHQIYEQVCYSDLVDETVYSDYESSGSDGEEEGWEMQQVANYSNVKVVAMNTVFSDVEVNTIEMLSDRLTLVDEMQPPVNALIVPIPNSTEVFFVSDGKQLYIIDGQDLIVVGEYRSFPKAVYRTYVTLAFGIVDVRCYAIQELQSFTPSYDAELALICKVQQDYDEEVAEYPLVNHYAFNLRNFFLTVDSRARRKFKFFAAPMRMPQHIPSLTDEGNASLVVIDKDTGSKFHFPIRITARLEVCEDGNLYAWHHHVVRTRSEVPRGLEPGVYTFMLTQKVVYGVSTKMWTPYCLTSFGVADTSSYIEQLEQRFDAPVTRARLMQMMIPSEVHKTPRTGARTVDFESTEDVKLQTLSGEEEYDDVEDQSMEEDCKQNNVCDSEKADDPPIQTATVASKDKAERQDPKLEVFQGRAPKEEKKKKKKMKGRKAKQRK